MSLSSCLQFVVEFCIILRYFLYWYHLPSLLLYYHCCTTVLVLIVLLHYSTLGRKFISPSFCVRVLYIYVMGTDWHMNDVYVRRPTASVRVPPRPSILYYCLCLCLYTSEQPLATQLYVIGRVSCFAARRKAKYNRCLSACRRNKHETSKSSTRRLYESTTV